MCLDADLLPGTLAATHYPGSRELLLEREGSSIPLRVPVRGEDDVRAVLGPELAERVITARGARVPLSEREVS